MNMASKIPPDEAFEFYFALGPSRSYQAVAERYGVTKRGVTKLATRDHWQKRVAEREEKARQASDQTAVETLRDLNVRHLKMFRTIEAKALETLRGMPLDRAIDAIRAMDLAIKGERLVLGEPTERTATDIEAIIKREHERWLIRNPGKEEGWNEDRQGDAVS